MKNFPLPQGARGKYVYFNNIIYVNHSTNEKFSPSLFSKSVKIKDVFVLKASETRISVLNCGSLIPFSKSAHIDFVMPISADIRLIDLLCLILKFFINNPNSFLYLALISSCIFLILVLN